MHNPAANATTQVVVDYGPDPAERGVLGLMVDTLSRVQGWFVHAYVGEATDPSRTFTGYGPALQDFHGAAAGGSATGVVYRNGANPELSSGVADSSPGAAAFAARLRRGGTVL